MLALAALNRRDRSLVGLLVMLTIIEPVINGAIATLFFELCLIARQRNINYPCYAGVISRAVFLDAMSRRDDDWSA